MAGDSSPQDQARQQAHGQEIAARTAERRLNPQEKEDNRLEAQIHKIVDGAIAAAIARITLTGPGVSGGNGVFTINPPPPTFTITGTGRVDCSVDPPLFNFTFTVQP